MPVSRRWVLVDVAVDVEFAIGQVLKGLVAEADRPSLVLEGEGLHYQPADGRQFESGLRPHWLRSNRAQRIHPGRPRAAKLRPTLINPPPRQRSGAITPGTGLVVLWLTWAEPRRVSHGPDQ